GPLRWSAPSPYRVAEPGATPCACKDVPMHWQIYLSGEIHTDWRERIAQGIADAGLPVVLTHPVTDHAASDDCGVAILGAEDDKFWHDHKGAGINAIRTGTLISEADVVIVRDR